MVNNIVLISGNDYAPLMGVTIFSILKNNSDLDLNFYIIDCGIGENYKQLLKEQITEFNSKFFFIKGESDKLEKYDFSLSKNYPFINTYLKIVLPSLLPKNIDSVLYIDCDILCVGSLKELFNVDISNFYMGACEEYSDDIHKSYLNLNKGDAYFNAGMIYFNLKKCRQDNVEDKLVNTLFNNPPFYHADQDIFNKTCRDMIFKLDLKYNLSTYFQVKDYKTFFKTHAMELVYSNEEIVYSQKNPVFFHFNGGDILRPWLYENHEYHDLYYSYVNESKFNSFIKENKFSLRDKLNNFLEFKLCKIFSILKKPDYFKEKNIANFNNFYEK